MWCARRTAFEEFSSEIRSWPHTLCPLKAIPHSVVKTSDFSWSPPLPHSQPIVIIFLNLLKSFSSQKFAFLPPVSYPSCLVDCCQVALPKAAPGMWPSMFKHSLTSSCHPTPSMAVWHSKHCKVHAHYSPSLSTGPFTPAQIPCQPVPRITQTSLLLPAYTHSLPPPGSPPRGPEHCPLLTSKHHCPCPPLEFATHTPEIVLHTDICRLLSPQLHCKPLQQNPWFLFSMHPDGLTWCPAQAACLSSSADHDSDTHGGLASIFGRTTIECLRSEPS